jgi:hypothetical protein
MLGSLQVRLKGEERPSALFTPGELEIIAGPASKALAVATPDEDVTFAVIGLHPALMGLMKKPLVTTGRLFVSAEKLHFIPGKVHEVVNDNEDRRLNPFLPGSRTRAGATSWLITTPAGGNLAFRADRADWLALPLKESEVVIMETPAAPAAVVNPEPAPPSRTVIPDTSGRSPADRLLQLQELRDRNLITADEYRAKRLEILNGL